MPTKDVPKVTMNISLHPDDKKFIKLYALEHDTTVSELFTLMIHDLRDEQESK